MQDRFNLSLQNAKLYWLETLEHFKRSHLPQKAAQLTLSSLLAAVPIITIIIGILGFTPALQHMQTQFFDFIEAHLTSGTSDAIFPYLLQFSKQAKNLPAAGLVALVITALLLLNSFENSVQSIWKIKNKRRLRERLLTYWAILTLGPILLAASLSLSGTMLSFQIRDVEPNTWISYLLSLGRIFMYFLILLTLNFLTPNTEVSLKLASIASFLGALALLILNTIFSRFAHFFSSYQVVYGAFAALPIFLIWLQSLWVIILATTCLCASIHKIKNLASGQD
ncbi:YihY family inner membrane protein [Marinomonas flavescens]|uniref:YihY family inner membrane protein n=1 Tax=Marinomonas flavescens TaxID=2529379 RepID=UPI00105641A1|nr:YihY family inner membrane protein [Marinomonas flavescens]